MSHIRSASESVQLAKSQPITSSTFTDLIDLREHTARLETLLAADLSVTQLMQNGFSRSSAIILHRRASNPWHDWVPSEHQDAILSALEYLSYKSTRRLEIYNDAAEQAPTCSPTQIKKYTQKLVREENERLSGNPTLPYSLRAFSISNPDATGCCRITGTLPPAYAAALKAELDLAFNQQPSEGDDLRTVAQRSADAFFDVIKKASATTHATSGRCSLVISMAAHDAMDPHARFGTNVGIDLSLLDLEFLNSDDVTDYIVVHNRRGTPIALHTASRSANFYQRIALFAAELVCQHPGCCAPASRCDAHHVRAWSHGGKTVIENLTLLCRRHHRMVDDNWLRDHIQKFNGQSHWVSPQRDTVTRNNSPAAKQAGGRRVTEPVS
ncbi:DUF222 domain-containing protein [Staphylococcus chromogenes]|nr:DUF222 domain-containing protein [Staphylococcus chromogenes]